MENFDVIKMMETIKSLDGKVIATTIQDEDTKEEKIQAVGTTKEKMELTLKEKLARAQTTEEALDYAKLDEMKSGSVPQDEEEREKLIDLYTEEAIDKLLKDI